jgi:hypothetical protein
MAEYSFPREWSEWVAWLMAGLHGQNRWRLPLVLCGMLFAQGRRTASSWWRAAGVGDDYRRFYYFLYAVGRKSKTLATQLFVLLLNHLPSGPRAVLALDDTPTRRYGPKVQGAGIHHNPTPGPADAKFVYGHIWVTLSWILRHPLWGTIGLPLWAMLYVRQKDIPKIPRKFGWTFQTRLQQAAAMAAWAAEIVFSAGKTLWVVADGFYAKRPFLKPLRALGVTVVSRLRKDARLFSLPPARKRGKRRGRGRPPKYGKKRLSLAKRAAARGGWLSLECTQYDETVVKKYKTFLATYPPAGGMIRVVIVAEPTGPQYFFCTDPTATAQEIMEMFADRAAIEQDFHDVKEVGGAGQQQVRVLWSNIGCFCLNLWLHTMVELWAWTKSKAEICDRTASPWDDPSRRPSHADRRKALRRHILQQVFSLATGSHRLPQKIVALIKNLLALAS